MTMNLDALLLRLNQQAPDRTLGGIEPAVWKRIADLRRRLPPETLWGWRAAAAALVLAFGALAGGAGVVAAPSAHALFSPNAYLAPSTLLERGR